MSQEQPTCGAIPDYCPFDCLHYRFFVICAYGITDVTPSVFCPKLFGDVFKKKKGCILCFHVLPAVLNTWPNRRFEWPCFSYRDASFGAPGNRQFRTPFLQIEENCLSVYTKCRNLDAVNQTQLKQKLNIPSNLRGSELLPLHVTARHNARFVFIFFTKPVYDVAEGKCLWLAHKSFHFFLQLSHQESWVD